MERYPILKDKKVILFLSRISWIKGMDILARAYGKIARERGDVHLLIVGPDEGGYEKKVKEWLEDEAVLDRVTFTGMLTGKEKLEAYSGSDIFVLPSYSENFGMAAVEAMACGLPIVISDQLGICREIVMADAGFVIPCDTATLSKKITEFLDNKGLCQKMSEHGRLLVEEKFTWNKITDKMITAYKEILGTESLIWRISDNSRP
jgi:glycosyltransferase involved in cell wall biosynthesis